MIYDPDQCFSSSDRLLILNRLFHSTDRRHWFGQSIMPENVFSFAFCHDKHTVILFLPGPWQYYKSISFSRFKYFFMPALGRHIVCCSWHFILRKFLIPKSSYVHVLHPQDVSMPVFSDFFYASDFCWSNVAFISPAWFDFSWSRHFKSFFCTTAWFHFWHC